MAENGKRDEELDLLLPWYVNGSLSAEERTAVEAYLESNVQAREEVALLSAMRQNVKEQPLENSPGDLGLQRLKREIKRGDQQQAPTTGKVVAISSWWRPLAVAACLAVVVQAGVMISVSDRTGGDVGIAGVNGPVLQVTFAPTATEQEIREVLQSAGTTIADGPTALGIYGLRLLAPGNESANIEEALVKLKARGDVVTFAERN
ncbi:hypothetical protein HBA54_00995 [Pelagibius litoralis]|uniref:Zinc-finger n=1 Tax=Pelagibius litoralis TaxID=374515 RepID=A0A967C2K8_9PROT|nr:hypothetical protein [Pelagibius litoralis]NIA67164.1 hypothetical protein [Pelagibius litoralis]